MTTPELLDDDTTIALQRQLDGRWSAIRESARSYATREFMLPIPGPSTTEQRARTLAQLTSLTSDGLTGYGFPTEFGGGGDLGG